MRPSTIRFFTIAVMRQVWTVTAIAAVMMLSSAPLRAQVDERGMCLNKACNDAYKSCVDGAYRRPGHSRDSLGEYVENVCRKNLTTCCKK